jgi:hypothetical protein
VGEIVSRDGFAFADLILGQKSKLLPLHEHWLY